MIYLECNIDAENQTVNIYHCNSYLDNENKSILEKGLYSTCSLDSVLTFIEEACDHYNLYKVRVVSKDVQAVIQQTWKIYQYMLNINKQIEVV